MKKILPITCIVCVLLLIACTKKSSDANTVYIRIANATGGNFSNFTLNAAEFGNITSGDTSKYILCQNVLPIPFANFIAVNNNALYIVDVVPTPYLQTGKYLMKVVNDTLPYRYRASFIKE